MNNTEWRLIQPALIGAELRSNQSQSLGKLGLNTNSPTYHHYNLRQLFNLFESLSFHLQNEYNHNYFVQLLWGLDKKMYVKYCVWHTLNFQ